MEVGGGAVVVWVRVALPEVGRRGIRAGTVLVLVGEGEEEEWVEGREEGEPVTV